VAKGLSRPPPFDALTIGPEHAAMHLAREPVSDPMERQNKLWMPLIRFELLSQPCHVNIYRAGSNCRIVTPHFIQQFIA